MSKQDARNAKDLLGMIDYEILMLRFSVQKLDPQNAVLADKERSVYLECFLLHYRNLIRFFSGKDHRQDKGDVSMAFPGVFCAALSESRAGWYMDQIKPLDNGEEGCIHQQISKLLAHCTEARVEMIGKEWKAVEMYRKIEPVIQSFERECLKRSDIESITISGEISNSTATGNSARIINFDSALRSRD